MRRFSVSLTASYRKTALLALPFALGSVFLLPDSMPVSAETPTAQVSEFTGKSGGGFIDGVSAYRQGQYAKAERIFQPLHEQAPDQSRITYYLALIKEQLGDFTAAKTLFEEVTLLDPNSEAARLSKVALRQFPAANLAIPRSAETAVDGFQLDPPPDLTALSAPAASQAPIQNPGAVNNQPMQSGNFSPQDLMMMQMMMGGMNNNNAPGSSFNPMMQGLMNQNQGNGQPGSNLDPNIMSTMMMNQMMQNFNMDFKGNNNDQ